MNVKSRKRRLRVHPLKQSASPRVRLRDSGYSAELNLGSDIAV